MPRRRLLCSALHCGVLLVCVAALCSCRQAPPPRVQTPAASTTLVQRTAPVSTQPAATPTPLDAFRAATDNRPAVRASLGVRVARPTGSNTVTLVIGLSVNRDASAEPAAYRIISFDDPAYAYEKFVQPVRAAVRAEQEAVAVPGCGFERFERSVVALTLPQALQSGCVYHVLAQGAHATMITGARTAQEFRYPEDMTAPALTSDIDLAVLGLRALTPVGPGIVALEFGPNFAPVAGAVASNYQVSINGAAAAVTALGRITKVDAYLPAGWPFKAIPVHDVFLQLARPFCDGDAIAVTVSPVVTRAADNAAITFRERASLSASLKVNQIGYVPDGPKVGYLGRWMGSFPEQGRGARPAAPANPALLFEPPPVFYVCDEASGAAVFTGMARLVHMSGACDEGYDKADYSGENVYVLDFTALAGTGAYFVSVPQVGRSIGFAVGNGVYERAFRVQSGAMFAQRCGIELKPPYSAWRRIACHTNGVVPTTQVRYEPHEWKQLAHLVDRAHAPLKIRGGHHDAGDYNPRSHLDVAQALMDAYEVAPQKFYDGQQSIPENTNGIPDILDEAAWALRLWVGLQDRDGGVFDGTESNGDPNFIQTVELDVLGDYAYAKDAEGSFVFAAALAQAARILVTLGHRERAATFLDKAVRAYDWACAHPPANAEQMLRHFDSPKAYAAAELLLTTGATRYRADFAAACVWAKNPAAALDEYKNYDQRRAAWAYARCPSNVVDARLQRAVRAAIITRADAWIANAGSMAYAFIRHPNAPINWGTGGQPKWLDEVIWAWHLTGAPRYRQWIIRTCDYTLGANPLNRSFIVGLGARTVRAPLHNSRYSHLGEVVDGMQVQGPHYEGDGFRVRETAYPPLQKKFAALQMFVDSHFAIAMDEGTADAMAKAMAVFGLLLPDHDRVHESSDMHR